MLSQSTNSCAILVLQKDSSVTYNILEIIIHLVLGFDRSFDDLESLSERIRGSFCWKEKEKNYVFVAYGYMTSST